MGQGMGEACTERIASLLLPPGERYFFAQAISRDLLH
jgi:hypothetical protein